MEMGLEALLLLLAALLAGGINAIAGGGGLLVFPALLLLGVAPISANATGAVGIWVGTVISSWAYRQDLKRVARRLGPLTLITVAGGALGAWLLLNFSDEGFAVIVPYLVAVGTLLFAMAPWLSRLSNRFSSVATPRKLLPFYQPLLLLGQGAIAIYGGFFGGGAGILMLTLLSLTNPGQPLQTLQAVKLWMATCINAAAISYFLVAGVISWLHAAMVAVGTSLGGYSSVYFAKKVSAVLLRRCVIGIGVVLSAYFFVTQ